MSEAVEMSEFAEDPQPKVTVYEELLAAVVQFNPKFPDKSGRETDNQYLIRLVKTIYDVDVEIWNSLSEQARDFCESFRVANNGKQDLPNCPGYTPEPAKAQENGHAEPKKARGRKPKEPKVEEPKIKETKEPKEPRRRKAKEPKIKEDCSILRAREFVVDNPSITLEQLQEKVTAAGGGLKENSIALAHRSAKMVIDLAKSKGFWAGPA